MNILEEFKNWSDAERWLSRHGYGIEQIRLEKIKWDDANAIVKLEPTAKPIAKIVKANQTKVVTTSEPK